MATNQVIGLSYFNVTIRSDQRRDIRTFGVLAKSFTGAVKAGDQAVNEANKSTGGIVHGWKITEIQCVGVVEETILE